MAPTLPLCGSCLLCSRASFSTLLQLNLSLALLLWVVFSGAFAQRNLTEIPEPNPTAELAAMHVAEGFEVNLFAANPDIAKPIHMNWDEQGRLWIASSKNYPQLKPGAKPSDEIIVLEDTNGDGRADRRTVFADNLMIPTGILPGDGGVYVANSTQLIHLADTDGDGQADRRRTVLSGFGTEDTHHLLHTLRWRPDGRMAMNQSIYIHSHIETPYGVKHLDGGGIWHFDPFTSQLEVFCKGFVNPWGHVVNPFGQSLVTDGAYFEGINYTFPGAVFATAPGATRWLSGLNPGSPKHCGLEIISGDAMPEDMQGVLVTNDFRGHRVCLFRLQRQGAGYRSTQLPELIRSDHIAFRPIDAKMGPDGALYIADWYNPIIQHGEVDFRDPRRDSENGRIWRITAKGKPPTPRPDYAQLDVPELVQLLGSSALWIRHFARSELAERDAESVDRALASVSSQVGSPSFQLQPLWIQLASHRLQPDLVDKLRQADDPRVRAAALRVIGEQSERIASAEDWLLTAIADEDDQVVLEAICGLHRIGSLAAVRGILQAASRPEQDQYLKFAIWNGLRDTESVWLPALQIPEGEPGALESDAFRLTGNLPALEALADAATTPDVARLLLEKLKSLAMAPASSNKLTGEAAKRMVKLIASQADAETLAQLVRWLAGSAVDPDTGDDSTQLTFRQRADWLQQVIAQATSRNLVPADAGNWLPELMQQFQPRSEGQEVLATAFARAAESWKVPAVESLTRWLEAQMQMPAPEQRESLIAGCLDALAIAGGDSGRQRVRELAIGETRSLAIRCAAITSLASFDVDTASRQVVELYQQAWTADSIAAEVDRLDSAVESILARKPGVAALGKAVAATTSENWDPAAARALLAAARGSAQNTEQLAGRIVAATGLDNAGWSLSPEWSDRILAKVQQSGDPRAGEAIYRREKLQCVSCHAIGESGINIGPNLVSLGGSSTPDYILESLIDPSAKVKEGFQTLNVLLDTDEIVAGLQKSRTDEQIQLLLADGQLRTIPTDAILEVREGKSLMPAGLLDQLSEPELVDLLAFLSRLGRTPEYTVDTRNWVRNWMTLQWTPEANRRLNRTSLDTAATDEPALSWRQISSRVDGSLPVDELAPFQPHRQTPKMAFVSFSIDCVESGDIHLELTQPISQISFWLDGSPRPTPAAGEAIELTAGQHRVVLGIQIESLDEPTLGCRVIADQEKPAVFTTYPKTRENRG